MNKNILLSSYILFALFFLSGCEEYNLIKGRFVKYPFNNQKIIYLKDDRHIPNYFKLICLNKEDVMRFLEGNNVDESREIIEQTLDKYNNELFIFIYGWGTRDWLETHNLGFSNNPILIKNLYLPNFAFNKDKKELNKIYFYDWEPMNFGQVSEFIDLYIFKKEDLIKPGSDQIELGYTFKYKTSYDFEKEERWGIVSGNVTFNITEYD